MTEVQRNRQIVRDLWENLGRKPTVAEMAGAIERAECREALVEQFEATMPAFDPNRSDAENVARMEEWFEARRRAGLDADEAGIPDSMFASDDPHAQLRADLRIAQDYLREAVMLGDAFLIAFHVGLVNKKAERLAHLTGNPVGVKATKAGVLLFLAAGGRWVAIPEND
jgi:hypothetical protein